MAVSTDGVRLVLEVIDPTTACIVSDVCFSVARVEDLGEIVEQDASVNDFESGVELENSDLEKVKERFGLKIEANGRLALLRLALRIDELPYKVHTNRELLMMLKGIKPFAYFSESYPLSSSLESPERVFEPYVVQGRFLKREYVIPDKETCRVHPNVRGARYVLYSLRHEEWRIDAFILVQETASKVGWSEGFERMVGSLLGYEDWQNEIFVEFSRRWSQDAGAKVKTGCAVG